MKWSEITEVESAGQFGGFVARAMFVPSIGITRSIASDPRFIRHVLSRVPQEHVLARRLSGEAGLLNRGTNAG
jgi:hypothetical protein